MAGVPAHKHAFRYADYLSWPEGERWELIEGTAYGMSPAPSRVHQEIVVEFVRQVSNQLKGTPCKPYVAPFDVRLPEAGETDDDIDTVVQPDLSIICDERKLDDRGCRGAPDAIVEVLSPHTASRDLILKRSLYEKHGVREYWTVHPTDRVVMVYRLDETGRFRPVEIREAQGTFAFAALKDVTIDFNEMFPPPPPDQVREPPPLRYERDASGGSLP